MSREYVLHAFRPPAALTINYREELNEQQYAAVSAPPGPALVLAGAGAGKTRTLTYRVAWLLEHGIAPEKILLLTFTNKAAREMMQRVTDLIGGDLSQLWGGTFHSVGNRILRRHADRLGYRPDFGIADREDARDLLAACITDAGIDVKAARFPKAEALADVFSMAANTGRTVTQVVERDYASFGPLTGEILEVFRRYGERKRQAGLMDFDDLLGLWLKLLREHGDLGEFYQRRFQWVLVDEYQDTNTLQGELIDALVARHRNLMAVGDDAQSIYSWRGANFANILDFPRRYAGAQVYRIETNYRSTPEILAVANQAIAANTRQFPKELRAVRPAGARPALVVCGDAREQAAFVAQRVLELRDEGGSLNDMCVLYRSHFHAVELQMELTRRNIPFLITSGIRFFEQAHIKDVAAYLKLVTNPYDELAFKRLVRMLPGIGGRGADKLWQAFVARLPAAAVPPPGAPAGGEVSDNDGGIPEVPPPPVIPVAPRLSGIAGSVPKKTLAAWAQFCATISQAESAEVRHLPGRMIRLVMEADYDDYLEATYENARNRREDLEQLAAYADQFRETSEFLGQLALQSNLEAESSQPAGEDDERLRLSSIHQAKGLEFGVVFVIMLCEGLFPSNRSLEVPEAEEEERRLFYVAVTRAKNELYLTRPLLRFMAGGGDALQQPSRFLAEIPVDLLEEWHLQGGMGGGSGWGGGAADRVRRVAPATESIPGRNRSDVKATDDGPTPPADQPARLEALLAGPAPVLALAPMQDVTDLPFWTLLARYGGPDVYWTEYFRVHATWRPEPWILESLVRNPTGRPAIAQLIGNDPEALVRAARELQQYPVAAIDLNLGCPAPVVYRKCAGGGLLREPARIEGLLAALRGAVGAGGVKFTVKTRLGFARPEEFEGLLPLFARSGIDLLTVHGRTVLEMYRTEVHYDWIARAVAAMPCPVLANGNVHSAHRAAEVLRVTGARGLMIGRGCIRSPWLFRQIRARLAGEPEPRPRGREVLAYVEELYDSTTPPSLVKERLQVEKMKKYMNFLGTGLPQAGDFLHRIRRATSRSDFFAICRDHLDHDEPMTLEGGLTEASKIGN